MTLVDLIKYFFTTFIYKPHKHDYIFDRMVNKHTEVMGLTSDSQDTIYKCNTCGKIIEVK